MRASLSRNSRHLVLCLAFAAASIGPFGASITAQTESNSTSKFVVDDADVEKGKVVQWLSSAKQAMQQKNYDLAEQAITNADKLAQQLGDLQLSYTPQQAREELAKLRNAPTITKVDAMSLLHKARRSLAGGNVKNAMEIIKYARDSRFEYDVKGDTPDRIENLIDQHKTLVQLHETGDPEVYNNRTVRFLLTQASGFLQYQDYAAAKKLAEHAKAFEATFKTGEMNPDQLLATIEKAANSQKMDVASAKKEALRLIAQAQLALAQDKVQAAKKLTDQALALNIPDAQFGENETRPWEFELKVREALKRVDSAVQPAAFAETKTDDKSNKVVTAEYDDSKDKTHIAKASHNDGSESTDSRGEELYRNALAAMSENDTVQALEYFQLAWQYRDSMNPKTRQAVQEALQRLQKNAPEKFSPTPGSEVIGDGEKEMFRQVQSKVLRERAVAERMLNRKDPRGALQHLNTLRREVESSSLADTSKAPLLRIVDRDLTEMERYIQRNISQIETEESNRMGLERVQNQRRGKYENDIQLQKLVEDFNKLIDEGRFAEAEVIARQASEIAPESEIVVSMQWKAKFIHRMAELEDIKNRSEDNFAKSLMDAQEAGIGLAGEEFKFANDWEQIRTRRKGFGSGRYGSEAEERIWNTLKSQKFQGEFNGEPLSEVVRRLSQAAGVNILFDQRAMALEQVDSSTQITKQISQPISIESVLKIVLNDVGLVFVVEDESIKVTNRDAKNKKTVQKTYYVGDLVMPIPNFSSPLSMNFITPFSPYGGMSNVGSGSGVPLSMPQGNGPQGQISPIAMAQQLPNSPFGDNFNMGGNFGPQTTTPQFMTMGPPKLGGITAADFTELISLIENTIQPDTWDSAEGLGTIRAFPSTLSLIVNQTQDVQDEIQDLLVKLRELNDVQIVIEVRFITLQDDFFERIGIDFDFRVNDNTGLDPNNLQDETNPTAIIGRASEPGSFQPTGDLDIPFTQNVQTAAFNFATGNPNLAAAANFGFAILSDIEVFFLIQAIKGDVRTNVTQAPIVTLFNGQVASVNDGAQVPFVTSVTPVVGDFAVAHQPIITLLPEGSFLNVQAVASSNRRFVKMTLVPFFSQIDQVDTFTFNGSRTIRRRSTSDSEGADNDDILDRILNETDDELIETGTTIQLPTISFTNVTTTVSVPDGGTILLGGVKRLSEGRLEEGVPFLANIPFVSRLFKNVGIGRETQSLMLMVTPRIIIQEEEELLQVGDVGQ